MPATRLLLIRHAESAPDARTPEADWPLSEAGRRQALELFPTLEALGPNVLCSSPYRRAIDTLQPYAAVIGREVTIERDLRERALTTGFHPDWRRLIRRAWEDLAFALPGCESGLGCQARVRACIDALVRRNLGRTLAVASHGNAIGLYLNSLDATFGYEAWAAMRNPEIFTIEYAAAGGPIWRKGSRSAL